MRTNSRESSDPYYDLFGDWELIISSFLSQYGLRIRTKEFESVTWDEFKSLLAGLAPETALGRMVAIRSETDKDVIKHFTKEQRRIYDEWRERKVEGIRQEPKTYEQQMDYLENIMAAMCGGGKH